MSDPLLFKQLLFRNVIAIALSILVGLIFGYPLETLLCYLLFSIGWHLRNLYRLHIWLNSKSAKLLPNSRGVWADIFYGVYKLQKRNRKRQKRLGKFLRRFRDYSEALPDALVAINQHGQIEWWNSQAEDLLKLSWPLDYGQRVVNLIRDPVFINYFHSKKRGAFVETTHPDNDDVFLEIRIAALSKEQRLVIIRDITENRKLSIMRRDFVANASHELRTPLTVVKGYVETLLMNPQLAPTIKGCLEKVDEQAIRMDKLIEELLTLSRLEHQRPGKRQILNMAHVIEKIVNDARALSGNKGHNISIDIDDAIRIRGGQDELIKAFSNLVFNAVRYTPERGNIEVTWLIVDDKARFSVKDDGIGISPVDIPRLTERFYRVDPGRAREQGGTGLGLSIVKHVLNRHDSELKVDSEFGIGSVFYCDFELESSQPQ